MISGKNNIEKKIKKKIKIPSVVKSLVVGGVIGLLLGFLSDSYLNNYIDNYLKNDSAFEQLLKLSGFFLIFFIGFMVHIVIHETGHLIFGLITNYSFVSFRIGSIIITKEDGKLKITKFSMPGTAGQCLMVPPEMKDGKYPFVMYNLGGVIMNLITSMIGILVVIFVKEVPFPSDAILLLSGLGGIFVVLTNGIPMKIGGIVNDGHNILSMLKDEETRRSFYVQLRVNGLQSQGTRIKDMPLEMFKLNEESDLTNPLNTAMGLMEYAWYLDNMDLEGAKRRIDSFIPYIDKVIPLFRNEINSERIFIELIGDCDKDFIDSLYDKNLKKYIKAGKLMISKKRLLMTYEGFYNEDKNMALKYYEEINIQAKKYPIKGEADMECMLANWIKKKLNI